MGLLIEWIYWIEKVGGRGAEGRWDGVGFEVGGVWCCWMMVGAGGWLAEAGGGGFGGILRETQNFRKKIVCFWVPAHLYSSIEWKISAVFLGKRG